MSTVSAMFRTIWNAQLSGFETKRTEQKLALKGIAAKISRLTDRLIETTNESLIRNYEDKLEKLETERDDF